MFGAPKIRVDHDNGVIRQVDVIKGAPCGATWTAAHKIKGLPVEEALTRFGLEVQFCCTANPAAWDPIYSKSPVHMAADVHAAVLKKELKKNT